MVFQSLWVTLQQEFYPLEVSGPETCREVEVEVDKEGEKGREEE